MSSKLKTSYKFNSIFGKPKKQDDWLYWYVIIKYIYVLNVHRGHS